LNGFVQRKQAQQNDIAMIDVLRQEKNLNSQR